MMKRLMRVLFLTLGLLLLPASGALAGKVHLIGKPAFTDNGLTLTAAGKLAGLGNSDITITLTATANPIATCTNPGGHQPPGQNPAPVTVTGTTSVPAGFVKNGTVSFHVTTEPPPTTISGAPDCPNGNWTETITDLAFTSATITVEQVVQGNSIVVLTVSCTFKSPTDDGQVPGTNVKC